MAGKNEIIFKLGMDTKEAASELKSFSSNAKQSVTELSTLLSNLKAATPSGNQKETKSALKGLDENIKNIEASSKALTDLAGRAEGISKTKGGKKLNDTLFKSIVEAQASLMSQAKAFMDGFDKIANASPMTESLRIDKGQKLKNAGNLFSLKFEEKLGDLGKLLNDIQNKAVRDIVAKTRAFEGRDAAGMGKAVADYASTSATLGNQEQLSKYYQSMPYRSGYLQTDYWKSIQGASRARFRGLSKGGYAMDETDVQIHHPFYEGLKGLEWKPENLQKLEGLSGFEHIQETVKQLKGGILNWSKQQADDLMAEANAQVEPEGTKVNAKVKTLHKQYQKNFDLLIRRAIDYYTELNKIVEAGGDPSTEALKALKTKAGAYERAFSKANVKGEALDIEVFKKQVGEAQLDYIKGVTDMALGGMKASNLRKMAETKGTNTSAGYYLDDSGKAALDEDAARLKQFSSTIKKGGTDPRKFLDSLRAIQQKRAEWINAGVNSNDEMLQSYSRVIEAVKPSRRISELRMRATTPEKQIATEVYASAVKDAQSLTKSVEKVSTSTKGSNAVIKGLEDYDKFVQNSTGFGAELSKAYAKLRSAFKTGNLVELQQATDDLVNIRANILGQKNLLAKTKRMYAGEKPETIDMTGRSMQYVPTTQEAETARARVRKEADSTRYGAMPGLNKSDLDYGTASKEQIKAEMDKYKQNIIALKKDIQAKLYELKQYNKAFQDPNTASLFSGDTAGIKSGVSNFLKEGTVDKSKTRSVAENVMTQADYYMTDLDKNVSKERAKNLQQSEYRLKQELDRINRHTERAGKFYETSTAPPGKGDGGGGGGEKVNWGDNERLAKFTKGIQELVNWRSTLTKVTREYDRYATEADLKATERLPVKLALLREEIALREKTGKPLTKGMLDFNIKEDERKITQAIRLIDRLDERISALRAKKQSPIRDALITGLEERRQGIADKYTPATSQTSMDKMAKNIRDLTAAREQYQELLNPTKMTRYAESQGITDLGTKDLLTQATKTQLAEIEKKLGLRKSEVTIANEIAQAENNVINKLNLEKQLVERIATLRKEVAANPDNKESVAQLASHEKDLKKLQGKAEPQAPIGVRIADEMEKSKVKILEAKEAVRLIGEEKKRLKTNTTLAKDEIKAMTKALDDMEHGYKNVSEGVGKNVGAFKKLGDGIGGVGKTMVEMAKWQSVWYLSKGTVFALPQLVGMGVEYAKEIDAMNFKLLRWRATSGTVTTEMREEVKGLGDEIRRSLLVTPGDFKETLTAIESLIGAGMSTATAKELVPTMTIMKSAFPEIDFEKFSVAAMGAFNVFKDSIEGATTEGGKFKILMEQLMAAQAESIARPEHFAKIMQYMSEMGKIAGMTSKEVFALSTTIADTGVTTSQSARLLSGFITQLSRTKTMEGLNKLFEKNKVSPDNMLDSSKPLLENLKRTMQGLREMGFTEKTQPTAVFEYLQRFIPKEEIKVFGALVDRYEDFQKRVITLGKSGGATEALGKELSRTIDGQLKMIKHTMNELGSAGNVSSQGLGVLMAGGLDAARGALLALNPQLSQSVFNLDTLGQAGKTAHSVVATLVTAFKAVWSVVKPFALVLKDVFDVLAKVPQLTQALTFAALIFGLHKLVNLFTLGKGLASFFGISLKQVGEDATKAAYGIKMTEAATMSLATKQKAAAGQMLLPGMAGTGAKNSATPVPVGGGYANAKGKYGAVGGVASAVGIGGMMLGSQIEDQDTNALVSKLALLVTVGGQVIQYVPQMAAAITKLGGSIASLNLLSRGGAALTFLEAIPGGIAGVVTAIGALGAAVGYFVGKWGYNVIARMLGELPEQIEKRVDDVAKKIHALKPDEIGEVYALIQKAEDELGTFGFVNADTLAEMTKRGYAEYAGSIDRLRKLKESLGKGVGWEHPSQEAPKEEKETKDIDIPDKEGARKRASELANLEKEIRNLQLSALKTHLDAMRSVYNQFYNWGWLTADQVYELELDNIKQHYDSELAVIRAGEASIREERRRTYESEVTRTLSPKYSDTGDGTQATGKATSSKGMKPEDVKALITKISAQEKSKVSEEVIYNLLHTESRLNPNAVSPMTKYGQAYGIGQVQPATARSVGVDPGQGNENLFDAETNITASIRYVNKMLVTYGNISDALGAYNAGPGGLNKLKKLAATKGTNWQDESAGVSKYVNDILNPSDKTNTVAATSTKPVEEAKKVAKETKEIVKASATETTAIVNASGEEQTELIRERGEETIDLTRQQKDVLIDTNRKYGLTVTKDTLDTNNQILKLTTDRLSKELTAISEHHKRKIALVDALNARQDAQNRHELNMSKLQFEKTKQLALLEANWKLGVGKMTESQMLDFKEKQARQEYEMKKSEAEGNRQSFYTKNATKLNAIEQGPDYVKKIEALTKESFATRLTDPAASANAVAEIKKVVDALTTEEKALLSEQDVVNVVNEKLTTENTYREAVTQAINEQAVALQTLNYERRSNPEAIYQKGAEGYEKGMNGVFKLSLEQLSVEYGKTGAQLQDITKSAFNTMGNSFSTLFSDVFKGELKSAEDYFRSFLDSLANSLGDFLSKQVVNSFLKMFTEGASSGASASSGGGGFGGLFSGIMGLFSGGGATAAAGAGAASGGFSFLGGSSGIATLLGTVHTGGYIMHRGGFVPRFHSGGLNSDEVPAILQKGEYVVSKKGVSMLDQINNGQMGVNQAPPPENVNNNNLRIVNVLDPSIVNQWATSAEGEKVLMNVIRRNQN